MILSLSSFMNQWIYRGCLQKHGWGIASRIMSYSKITAFTNQPTNHCQNKQTNILTMELDFQEALPEKKNQKLSPP